MSKHSKGPWRRGRLGTVVCDESTGLPGADDVAYYGGHLVCESVAQKNIPIIAAAPEMYEVLEAIKLAVEMRMSPHAILDENFPIMDGLRAVLAKVDGCADS